jgi:hypothetical protein
VSAKTPRFGLDYLDPSQSQPEVKFNANMDIIDANLPDSSDAGSHAQDVVRGRRGLDGHRGRRGFPGKNGAAGAAGAAGAPGSAGAQGTTGPTGILIARNMRDVRRLTRRPPGGLLNPTGVIPATYSSANLTINAYGLVTNAANGSSGTVLANITPDTHPAIATANDDEFEAGSSIDTTGARASGATAWTWLNQLAASTVVTSGSLVFTTDASSASAPNINAVIQPVAGSTFTYNAKYSGVAVGSGASGLLFRNSANSHLLIFGLVTSGSTPVLFVARCTSATTSSTVELSTGTIPNLPNKASTIYVYLQIRYDGTNLLYSISPTGVPGTYVQVYTETAAVFLSAAPTHVGIFGESLSIGTPGIFTMDWFRKTA